MYFAKFPTITYPFEINGVLTAKKITDITTSVRIIKEVMANLTSYDEYDIQEGDTPEIISEKVYGSPLYHWVLMIANDRYDYTADFPLTTYELEQYVNRKYGADAYSVHHYEDENGNVINQGNINVYGITSVQRSVPNYEYELRLNESKRRIKLISPENLFRILAQFKSLV
jgi:hypothetical protein